MENMLLKVLEKSLNFYSKKGYETQILVLKIKEAKETNSPSLSLCFLEILSHTG